MQFGSPNIENLGKFSRFYTLRGGFSTFFVEKPPRSVHPRLNGVYFFFSASFSGSAGSGVMYAVSYFSYSTMPGFRSPVLRMFRTSV